MLGRQPSVKSFALWTFFEKIHSESAFREYETHTENDEDSDTEISEPKSEVETTSTYMEKNVPNDLKHSNQKDDDTNSEITGNSYDQAQEKHISAGPDNCMVPSNMAARKNIHNDKGVCYEAFTGGSLASGKINNNLYSLPPLKPLQKSQRVDSNIKSAGNASNVSKWYVELNNRNGSSH
ncbi:hypothetical protein ACF0H5_023944 [Mactra antiquata]